MSEKKKQHLVPECYLRAFIDPEPPEGVLPSEYEPAVWVSPKALNRPARRRAPGHKTFWKNRYYNLEGDDPSRPVIEDSLAAIEGKYASALRVLEAGGEPTVHDALWISLFVATMSRRTEAAIDHWQSQIDAIQHLYRQVDRGHNGNEQISDDYWKGAHEGGKRMVLQAAEPLARALLSAGVSIVQNESDLPFFTSDEPVVYNFLHSDDLLDHSLPPGWLRSDVDTNRKEFFCYCALSPRIAFVSSPLIERPRGSIYRQVTVPDFPVGINILTQLTANEVIVSSSPRPYLHYQDRVKRSLELAQAQLELPAGHELVVYTTRARYDLRVSRYERGGSHPIKPEVRFWTEDIESVRAIADDGEIEQVLFYENRQETGGTRNLVVKSIGTDPETPTVLVTNW